MHYPYNDLRLSNMVSYKRHGQKDVSMSEKNAGPKTDGQNTKGSGGGLLPAVEGHSLVPKWNICTSHKSLSAEQELCCNEKPYGTDLMKPTQ